MSDTLTWFKGRILVVTTFRKFRCKAESCGIDGRLLSGRAATSPASSWTNMDMLAPINVSALVPSFCGKMRVTRTMAQFSSEPRRGCWNGITNTYQDPTTRSCYGHSFWGGSRLCLIVIETSSFTLTLHFRRVRRRLGLNAEVAHRRPFLHYSPGKPRSNENWLASNENEGFTLLARIATLNVWITKLGLSVLVKESPLYRFTGVSQEEREMANLS